MSLEDFKRGVLLKRFSPNLTVALSWLPNLWPGLGALLIGMLLARWTWIFFGPQPPSIFPPKSDLGGKESETFFGKAAASAVTSNSGESVLGNVHLMGVFSGKESFAVLKIDDKTQRGVALGEEVIKGTKLIEVDADHVILEHNGTRQQLYLESKTGKDKAAQQQPSVVTGVDQAVAGWNQAHQMLQNERTQMRQDKAKEVHQ